MKKKQIADVFLIIGLIILTIIMSVVIYKEQKTESLVVEISIDGKIVESHFLDEDYETMLSSGNKIIIKDSEVYIEEANCPDKLCIKQGHIHKVNESIICLPNKLVVRIVENVSSSNDGKDIEVDAVQ